MIYLDNAATTWPKPQIVREVMSRAMVEYGANPGRSGHRMSIDSAQQIYLCRKTAAEFFGADSVENVVFTLNCTHALNMAIKGTVKRGDHVITSSLEHNAVTRPLYKLWQDGVIEYDSARVIAGDDDATLKNFESLINSRTTVIVCTHVSNVFGITLPIEKIGKLAKSRGITFIVDAAQSAGVIPINIKKMNIDILCVPGHKGLYGPMGTGMMILSDNVSLDTIIEGGTGSKSRDLSQPDFLPDRFESGTCNSPGIIGLRAGMEFVRSKGIANIYNHEMNLIQHLYDGISSNKNVKLYTVRPSYPYFAPVLSFNIAGLTSEETGIKLDREGFALRAGYHCSSAAHRAYATEMTGTVRACPSIFSNINEINKLAYSINRISNISKNF